MEYITSSDFHFKNTAVALGKFEYEKLLMNHLQHLLSENPYR